MLFKRFYGYFVFIVFVVFAHVRSFDRVRGIIAADFWTLSEHKCYLLLYGLLIVVVVVVVAVILCLKACVYLCAA